MLVKQTKKQLALFWLILLTTFKEFFSEHSFTYGAALAYYSIFAIVPTLYLALTLLSVIFGEDYLLNLMFQSLNEMMGEESALQITEIVTNLNISNSSLAMNIISIFVMVYSTTAIFWSIKSSLHLMWHLKPEIKSKILKTLIDRFLSLLMLLIIGLILSIAFVSEALFMFFTDYLIENDLKEISYGLYVAEHSIAISLYTLIFILLFKFLPDAILKWKIVLGGALFTGSLFYLGTYLVSWYLSVIPIANKLGAAGPILIVLLWVYYSAQIVFLGAKFTHVLAKKTDNPIKDSNSLISGFR